MFSSLDSYVQNALQNFDTSRFGPKDKVFFFKELSYLLYGGVSLVDAFDVISSSSENFAVQKIASSIVAHIREGKQLSYAMTRLPDYFDEWDYNIVRVGEKSGDLPHVLSSLAQEYAYLIDIKNKYVSALMYPIVLIIISVVAVLSLFLLVLPNIFVIADQFQMSDLPFITQMLKNLSDFLFAYWKQSLIGSAVLWFVLFTYFTSQGGRKVWFSFVMSLPLFGKLTKYFYLIKWARYVQLMLKAGLSYIQTFQLLRDVLHISAYEEMTDRILQWLQKWQTIYDALNVEKVLIPANVSTLIRVGEQTANLPDALANVISLYQDELDVTITRLAKVVEPIMLLFVWWIVVVIALGVFGLILQIMEWVWI